MMFCARAAGCARRTCMQMASFSACSRGGPRSAVELDGWSKTIGRASAHELILTHPYIFVFLKKFCLSVMNGLGKEKSTINAS